MLYQAKSQWPQSPHTKGFLESMRSGFHDAEEKMLSMTMGCDGPHSKKVLKRKKQNDKQLFHQVQQ